MATGNAVELTNISKRFGEVIANNKVTLSIKSGEILSLLGENGSGKTSLMNILAGIYFPDEGKIKINGHPAVIRSPKDAYDLGIGMVHQHFMLIDVFTAAENIILGIPGKEMLNMKAVVAEINELIKKFGFELDPEKKIYEMSVSEKQTVEIIKILYRGANILILDEPTAVLTPHETKRLFSVLRNMKNDGKTIILITHKLREVFEISDRVAVLRKGEYVGTVETKDSTELSLTEMMVGKKVNLDIKRTEPKNIKERLIVKDLTCYNKDGIKALDDVSFTAYGGEILGIAGIAGSGQKELLEAIAGLIRVEKGNITYIDEKTGKEEELVGKTPMQIKDLGVSLAFVPEDRLGMGLVGSMGMTENMMLRNYRSGHSFFTERKAPIQLAQEVKNKLKINTPSISTPVRKLSGGNVQKVLVGREISLNPKVLMTAYAVRGLDISTSYTIYNLLNKEKEDGVAVIYVGEDLDVLIALCDRILVLCGGRLSGIVDARKTTKEEIGLLMTVKEDK
jgi:ABC-type uncharacterized transport system ATPase subunit